ncbi:MAG: maltose alpha-D-glucosyltransferase [Gammaproteobacteria bacterium]
MTALALSWEEDPIWYRDAIIYQLHVKAFFDSSNDGMGDLRGLSEKLNYVQDLGINTIWLLPFYPSPLRDDGYDIADYHNVHPDYGSRADFRQFVRAAHRRGLKVITELVINHTSEQHPWFQAARRARKGSVKRNYYVWSDSDQEFSGTRVIFTDTETSNWAWDPVAQQYYWHRFFSHQPDLNFNNPQVTKAVIRAMRFWLDQGVDGLRLDAIPYLCEREGTNNENLPETHAVIKQMRAVIDAHYQNRMLLAEANQWPEDVREYFGEEDECHMAYHFPLMPRVYMALAQEDRHPIVEILQQTPEIPQSCQWAIFLRNHDELTLEMVTDKERDYMYLTYAADPRMRLNLGIRRRLAPLLDNDVDKIKLMNGLLLSMPGSPIIYYGDEIGMGDNIYLGDRDGVRTPMQWSPDRNAGFSRADPQKLYLPPIMDPIYGYEAVNVESQSRDPSSLLSWMKRLIAVRRSHQTFGRGELHFLASGNRKILAYTREYGGEIILCVANLARSAQPVELDLSGFKGRVPVELLGRTPFPPIGERPYLLTLSGYAFYWFSLATDTEAPAWHQELLPPAELPVLVLFAGLRSFLPGQTDNNSRRAMERKLYLELERGILPQRLPKQRWFAAKGQRIERVEFRAKGIWQQGANMWLMACVVVELGAAEAQEYFLPLAIAWERDNEALVTALLPTALAKVRERERVGVLYDACADEAFCRAVVDGIRSRLEVPLANGRLRFSASRLGSELIRTRPDDHDARRVAAASTNTTVVLGDLFLKAYRRLQPGVNPELETGRFLTDIAPFPNIAPLLGAVELEAGDRARVALAIVQGYRTNQGDAWTYTVDYLKRFLGDALSKPQLEVPSAELHSAYLFQIHTLGTRTAELHRAFGTASGDPAFEPEPTTEADLRAWIAQVRKEAELTLNRLKRRRRKLPPVLQQIAERLLAAREALGERINRDLSGLCAAKTRYHGDYHLAQVLVAENDFILIDFEGEPARALMERRRKHSPLRDVAGMLRSFNYAASSALAGVTAERSQELERLAPLAKEWEHVSANAFLTGYREAIGDCPSYPERCEHAQGLIELFTIEKAFYELRYELDNRPEWIAVPLQGLDALLSQARPR